MYKMKQRRLTTLGLSQSAHSSNLTFVPFNKLCWLEKECPHQAHLSSLSSLGRTRRCSLVGGGVSFQCASHCLPPPCRPRCERSVVAPAMCPIYHHGLQWLCFIIVIEKYLRHKPTSNNDKMIFDFTLMSKHKQEIGENNINITSQKSKT